MCVPAPRLPLTAPNATSREAPRHARATATRAAKTYDFTWEATTPDGREKKKGEMNAVSANVVRSNLRHTGLVILVKHTESE